MEVAPTEKPSETPVKRLLDSLGSLSEPVAKPVLIAISGLPGTGKTYVANELRKRLGFVILESDALRKVLFATPTYSLQESGYLFKLIYVLIEILLKKSIPLILDATNLSERYRERLYSIAEQRNARLILVSVEAPPEVVRQRLTSRAGSAASKSDADWEVYQKLQATADKIKRNHYVVDTSQDINPVIDKIVREVNR